MDHRFDDLRAALARLVPVERPPTPDLILGPCVVDHRSDLQDCALVAQQAGATWLRGGAVKLRTRHDAFAGHGEEGWEMLASVAKIYGLKTVSEVTTPEEAYTAASHVDALQIGARQMWNFPLFRECRNMGKTVVLKRGLGATTLDWLAAAERLQVYGCKDLILCERGSMWADGSSRNVVDVSVLAFLAEECSIPVWLDVSHSAGDPGVALAVADRMAGFGLDGIMAEVHPDPARAKCDAEQAIPLEWLRGRAARAA